MGDEFTTVTGHQKIYQMVKDDVYRIVEDVLADEFNQYYEEEGAEFVAAALDGLGLRRSFQMYRPFRDYQGIAIVTNVKGEGFPDWDDVFAEAAKEAGVPEEWIRGYGGRDFWDQFFWDDLSFEDESFGETIWSEYSFKYVRAGRSGGYVGVLFDWDMVSADETAIEQLIGRAVNLDALREALDEREFTVRGYTDTGIGWIMKDEVGPEDIESDNSVRVNAYEWIADVVIDKLSDVPVEDYMALSPEAVKFFEWFSEAVDETVKYFAGTERWVESIIANEYWEEQ